MRMTVSGLSTCTYVPMATNLATYVFSGTGGGSTNQNLTHAQHSYNMPTY